MEGEMGGEVEGTRREGRGGDPKSWFTLHTPEILKNILIAKLI